MAGKKRAEKKKKKKKKKKKPAEKKDENTGKNTPRLDLLEPRTLCFGIPSHWTTSEQLDPRALVIKYFCFKLFFFQSLCLCFSLIFLLSSIALSQSVYAYGSPHSSTETGITCGM